MSRFTGPLVGQYQPIKLKWYEFWKSPRGMWLIHEPFDFLDDNGQLVVRVPGGNWSSDLASTDVLPPLIGRAFPPDGPYAQAAVVHDFVCAAELFPIKRNNEIMSLAMDAIPEVGGVTKKLVRAAIDIGTRATYGEHTVERIKTLRGLIGVTDMQRPLWPDGKWHA